MYEVICVVVLGIIFHGANSALDRPCRYGICKPYRDCQSVQALYNAGGTIPYCPSPGNEGLVCCPDDTVNTFPLAFQTLYFFNMFSSVFSHSKPKVDHSPAWSRPNSTTTSTTRIWHPTSTSTPWYRDLPATQTVPITNNTGDRSYSVLSTAPTSTKINHEQYPTYSSTTRPWKSPTRPTITRPSQNPTYSTTTRPWESPTRPTITRPTQNPTYSTTTRPWESPTRPTITRPSQNPTYSATTRPWESPTRPTITRPSQNPTYSTTTRPWESPTSPTITWPTQNPTYSTATRPLESPTRPTITRPSQNPTYSSTTRPWESPTPPTTTQLSQNSTYSTTTRPWESPTRPTITRPSQNPTYSTITRPWESPTRPTITQPSQNPTYSTTRPWQSPTRSSTIRSWQNPTVSTSSTGDGSHPIVSVVPIPTTERTYVQYPTVPNRPQQPTSTDTNYEPTPVPNRPTSPITVTDTTPEQYPTVPNRPTLFPTNGTAHSWPTNSTSTVKPVATILTPSSSTTEYMPTVYDYVSLDNESDECPEIDVKLTTKKTGRPAWDRCIDYQQLVYPCETSTALLGNLVRVNTCTHAANNYRTTADLDEFPHLVVLGTTERPKQWDCTGTLISERFTLASAHCVAWLSKRNDIYVAVGAMHRVQNMNIEVYKEYKIESIEVFKPTAYILSRGTYQKDTQYHDIALLKSATDISLNQWVVPACLDVFGDSDSTAMATRWVSRSWDYSNRLQKNYVQQINQNQYLKRFKNKSRVANQIGYSVISDIKYNCKYNNDSSLTVQNHMVSCMYTIKGLSSALSPNCGKSPSVSYTKISTYLDWIEKIVWPNDV